MNGEKQIQTNLRVDLSKCATLVCKCGNGTFTEVITLKKISALLSPTGREVVVELRQKICSECGEKFVIKEMEDKGLMDEKEEAVTKPDPGI